MNEAVQHARFPFCPCSRTVLAVQGALRKIFSKPGKDFPSPRTNRAPLTAAGRSEDLPMRRESGQMQSRPFHLRLRAASRWSAPSCTTSLE